jgi:hypothetical protein
VHERGRELEALLVAERERLGPVAGSVGDAEQLDHPIGLRARVLAFEAVQTRQVDELIEHAHLRVEAALLGQVANRRRVSASTSRPRQRTLPASACSTPSAIRIAVVFPAPFGPTNPTISPAGTRNDTSSSATTSPKRRTNPTNSSASVPDGTAVTATRR